MMNHTNEHDFTVVAVGASAGNQQALKEFFSEIPGDVDACFIVVIHLLRYCRTLMPEIISRFTDMPVVRVSDSCPLRRGHVYVMPENVNMQVRNRTLYLQPRTTNQNIAVDWFFESLSRDLGGQTTGVILSGMGTDGTRGANLIHDRGGRVLVQDPDTTDYKGMPQSVISFDHPEIVSSPKGLGKAIVQMIRNRHESNAH